MENLVESSRRAGPAVLNVRGMRILVTGHTGFKGAWLCEWLLQAGAKVSGIALPPESSDGLFTALQLETRLEHTVCDIRDDRALAVAVRRADPEIILHVARGSR